MNVQAERGGWGRSVGRRCLTAGGKNRRLSFSDADKSDDGGTSQLTAAEAAQ